MLSLEQQIKIVTGRGAWHINDFDGVLPSFCMADGPHGLRKQAEGISDINDSIKATCFPTASALANSFDEEVVSMVASAIADEALAENVHMVLGPGINMKRSPLCGRNFEYYSEDPYLAGKLAASFVKAMQSKKVGCSLKHFAVNSQETNRNTSNSQVDERALREIYLAAFETVVKEASPATIMASYNRVNGTYSCENEHLLTEILRNEWKYDGTVISDWGASVDLAKCLKAGMDLEMPDSNGNHTKLLREALKDGSITEEQLKRAADKVVELVDRWIYDTNEVSKEEKEKLLKKNHAIAHRAACACAVLLKNNGVLPIEKPSENEKASEGDNLSKEVVIIGELANEVRFQGGGSSHINRGYLPTLTSELKDRGFGIRYFKGYPVDSDEPVEALENEVTGYLEGKCSGESNIGAKNDTIVIFCGGLTDRIEGEGFDREGYDMPENQIALYEKVRKLSKNLVFLAFGGSPYDLGPVMDADAILNMYLSGEAVMEAAADILTGEVNPSGKLAETYPMKLEDTPCNGYFGIEGNQDICYVESLFIGYRFYDRFKKEVRFPFGYGLSYTEFEYSDLEIEDTDSGKKVSYTITNTGLRDGAEASQVYVKNPECTYLRAEKELKGFAKVFLKVGESKRVSLEIPERGFSIFDTESGQFIVPEGEYELCVGASSRDIRLSKKVNISGVKYDKDDRETLPGYFGSFNPTMEEFEKLYAKPLSDFTHVKRGEYTMYNSLSQLAADSFWARAVMWLSKRVVYRMYKGVPHDDPSVVIVLKGMQDAPIDTVVNQSSGILKYKWARKIVDSANK